MEKFPQQFCCCCWRLASKLERSRGENNVVGRVELALMQLAEQTNEWQALFGEKNRLSFSMLTMRFEMNAI